MLHLTTNFDMRKKPKQIIDTQHDAKLPVSSSVNNKVIEKRYFYYHGHDCYIYETICGNCKQKVGGWSESQANEAWDKHCC